MSGWVPTRRALADLEDIHTYGEATWGERQAKLYIEELYELFGRLSFAPGLGRQRPELGVSMRAFPHTSHLVFYLQWNDRVIISRVLHGSMDHEKVFDVYDPITDLPD